MAKYKAYPEYKKINSFWVNIIPSHWNYILFKRVVCDIKDGTHGTHSRAEVGLPLLSAKNIQNYGIEINDDESLISEREYREITRNGFPQKNDLLITCVGTIGRSCVYPFIEPIAFQRSVAFLRLSTNASPYFYKYYVESKPYQCQLEATSKTSAQSGVYMGDLVNTLTVFPTTHEQVVIAEFLDHETAKIDNLIEKQQQLIELLKEKRQAVISHAVTKGLNPDVPMKDSGVEWLGEVPEHWGVSKFGYISLVVRGGSPRPAGDPALFNGDYSPWVTVAEITKDNEIYLESTDTFLTKKGSEQCRVFKAGTLVLSNSGATLGVPKILKMDANANDGVVGFESLRIDHEYAYFYLSTLTNNLRESIKQGSGQPNLNTDIVKSIAVPIPPENEMQFITSSIKKYIELYALIESSALEQVKLLQERRTALISAAVTGKIDVRDWVAPNACEAEVSQEVTA